MSKYLIEHSPTLSGVVTKLKGESSSFKKNAKLMVLI